MTTAIQLLRSGEANLRPDPITLADGMPMVNTNQADPGLYFRLENNNLCKIGPAHVGPLQPNLVANGFPGNTKGEMWLNKVADPAPDVLKVYDGEEWIDVGGAAQGIEGSVQYYKDGALAGNSLFVYDEATSALSVRGLVSVDGLNIGPNGDTDFVQIANDGIITIGDLTVDNSLVTGAYAVKWPAEAGTLALITDIPDGVVFYGNILVSDPAPVAAPGHLYVNSATAVADASWVGIAGQTVIEDQYVFYTAANQWELGGTSNLSNYVTLDSAQTIAGSKTFSAATQFNNPLNLGATATIAGANINITGSTLTTINGPATVTGAASFSSTVTMSGDLTSFADITCVDLTVGGNLGTTGSLSAGSLAVTGNSVLTTLTATDITADSATINGAVSAGTLSTVGLATLDSLTVTNNTSLTTLSASGLATISSLAVSTQTSTATLTTTGLATLESLTVTNASNVSALTASGLVTADSLVVTTSASCANLSVTTAAGIQSLSVTAKATSASTVAGDPGSTLITKDYFEENAGRWFDDVPDNSLYPKTASRNVKIGGTLPASPAILLNADGTASYTGAISIGTNLSNATSAKTVINGTGTITSQKGGAAVDVAFAAYSVSSGRNNVQIRNDGTIETYGSVIVGGTLPASPNITLAADGAVTAAGAVNAPVLGSSDNVDFYLEEKFQQAGIGTARGAGVLRLTDIDGTQGAQQALRITQNGTQTTDATIALNYDGSLTAAGYIESADKLQIKSTSLDGGTPAIYAYEDGGNPYFTVSKNGGVKIGGNASLSDDLANITLDADGSITAGKITAITFDIDALPFLP